MPTTYNAAELSLRDNELRDIALDAAISLDRVIQGLPVENSGPIVKMSQVLRGFATLRSDSQGIMGLTNPAVVMLCSNTANRIDGSNFRTASEVQRWLADFAAKNSPNDAQDSSAVIGAPSQLMQLRDFCLALYRELCSDDFDTSGWAFREKKMRHDAGTGSTYLPEA